jgi:hypothetical protein
MGAGLGSLKHERFSKFKWWKVCISVFFSGEISPFLDKEIIGEFSGFFVFLV